MVSPMACYFKGRIVCRLVPDELHKRCITSKVVADYAHREIASFLSNTLMTSICTSLRK